MRILIVAATYAEIAPFLNSLSLKAIPDNFIDYKNLHLKFVVTGVGMVATGFALGKELALNNFDLAINVGIAGSFSRKIEIGEVVEVAEDFLSELGAEDDEDFLTLEEMELGEIHFIGLSNESFKTSLKKVRGITVNKVHGNEESIEEVKAFFTPQVESMEGAAFLYSCEETQTQALQIRSISNYVERRNKNNWNIPLAIKNLNKWLKEYLDNKSN